MYNEQFKKDFINFREEINKAASIQLKTIFDWTAQAENKYGKDVCNFSMQQILELYRSRLTTSLSFLMNLHSQLSIYAKYCFERNMIDDGQNHFLEIQTDLLRDCLHDALIEVSTISRNDLLPLVSRLDNPFEQFIVLGLFEGIMGQNYVDFIQAKGSDIDKDTNMITLHDGRKLKISTSLVEYGINAAESYEYTTTTNATRHFQEDSEGWIIKSKANTRKNRPNPRMIQVILSRIESATENSIFRTASLRASGFIENIRNFMEQDGIEDVKKCAIKHQNELVYRYGDSLFARMIRHDEYIKYINEAKC